MSEILYTTDGGLPKPTRYADEKEAVYAAALDLINKALFGYLDVASGDATYTLLDTPSARQSRTLALKLTSTLTAARTIKIPIDAGTYRNRIFIIWNATPGGFKVTIKTTAGGSPTGIDIANGYCRALWHDGTNVYAFGPEINPTTGLRSAIGARVFNSANIAVADSTDTGLTFNSERYDSDGLHSTSVNTGRLTFPYAGKWRVTGSVRWAANAVGLRVLYIGLNGTPGTILGQVSALNTGGSVGPGQQVTCDYVFAVNDYVSLIVYQDSGGSLNVTNNANYSPEFWCDFLGA